MLYFLIAIAVIWIASKVWGGYSRWNELVTRFGDDAARRIQRKEIWQGETLDTVLASFGKPLDIKEHVLKKSTKHTYCYQRIAHNRYALRVHLQDGTVVGWDK